MTRKLFAFAALAAFCCIACNMEVKHGNAPADTPEKPAISSHPDWSYQSNIYEVNVRQYTREGTFKAFERSLPRLKEMGVEVLWFMPITPIGLEGRKGNTSELGSYYAVK